MDVHERRSGVPDALCALGFDVHLQKLAAGDYAIDGVALIERKTVRGLHLALIDGRLWRQLGRIRRQAKWRYLVLEGHSIYDGPLKPSAVRGLAIAVDDLGISIVRSRDEADSAEWIARIAVRRRGGVRNVNRPAYAQRPQRDEDVFPPERALAAAPGVSTVTARKLLDEFGSLTDVLLAHPDELIRVEGIGVHRADAIHQLATSTSDSGVSRNRGGPST